MSKKQIDVYRTGKYLRLSQGDEDIDGWDKQESNSISNQKLLIEGFIDAHDDLKLVDVFIEMKIANLIQFESLNTQEIGRNKGLLTYSTMSEAFIFLQSSMRKKIRGFKC